MNSQVALIRCDTYDPTAVDEALQRGLELLGGVQKFVRPGEALLLKPNLLAPDPPEKCTTTHPSVFKAAARAFLTAGAHVGYGDSPAAGMAALCARVSGLAAVAKELNVPLGDFTTPVEIHFPEGRQNKNFVLAKAVADLHNQGGALVNLPKLKTHGFMRMTGAVKNLFGCIPGLLKAEFHVKLPDPHQFARMLVDLNLLLQPRLHIMDGILGMEGNGPRSGTPFPMHALLLSSDPVALDAVMARLMGLDLSIPPTLRYGQEFGLGTCQENEIQVLGDAVDVLRPKRFHALTDPVVSHEPSKLSRFTKRWVVPRPAIRAKACTRCGTCVKMCPVTPKAVDWVNGNRKQPPAYNYERCIRCYCCQELCPEKAIRIRRPLLGRLIRR